MRPRRTDRRALRTRRALGAALVELMLARKFDDISVQQLLDRAGVGRATFYAHFRNKHDLLMSDAERFLGALEAHFLRQAAHSRRLAPVAELFSHVGENAAFLRALEQSGLSEIISDLFAGHLARLIDRRIATLRPDAGTVALPRAASARIFAAALIEMMRWWLDRAVRPSAREMDDQFHDIVWGGLDRLGR